MRLQRTGHAGMHPTSPDRRRVLGKPRLTAVAGVAVAVALALALAGIALAGAFGGPGAAAGAGPAARAAAGATTGRPGSGPAARAAAGSAAARPGSAGQLARTTPGGRTSAGRTRPAQTSPAGRRLPREPRGAEARTAVVRRGQALRTSCTSVAHIGDSTSVDLSSPDYLPDAAQRLAARYADVGVRTLRVDASGGRSIVEVLPGQVNGYDVARAWWDAGYRGCWVFALGTNDTANVAAGSGVGLMARIERMMSVAHGEPVMWVNTRTLLPGGPWAEANQQSWDAALVKALAMYPNMRILNWAAVARPGWFLSDGIHYTSAGCAARAEAIADGLARAFPEHGHSHGRIAL